MKNLIYLQLIINLDINNKAKFIYIYVQKKGLAGE